MKFVKRSFLCVLVLLITSLNAFGEIREPDPYSDPNVRGLPTDYVRSWHIFIDTETDGILNPGDTHIGTINNWWTPLSAGTQYNYLYRQGQESQSGVPFSQPADPNHASSDAYWLDREAGTISFYMTYSQLDNSDYSSKTVDNPKTYDYRWLDDPAKAEMLQQQNMYKNGYAMGWLINNYDGSGGGDVAGNVKMDILIHNGKSADSGVTSADYGATSNVLRANPQLAVSDDISIGALDTVSGHLVPPVFTDINGNDVGYQYAGLNDKRWATESALDAIVDSMEVREYDPSGLNPGDMVNPGTSPNEILANLTDGNGNPYAYQDAFLIRDPSNINAGADFNEGETDGGVIAGLSGYDYYSQAGNDNDWGEQQVIRIDIDPASLEGLTKIKFFDFGYAAGSSQISPMLVEFDVVNGQIYYNGLAIPDNRIYIATVVPEPFTLAIVGIGGVVMLINRKRK